MARPLPERNQRREIFLNALAAGSSVSQACAHGRLAWRTVYLWRQKEPEFRDAWNAALRAGADAAAARFDDELMRRAVDGFAEPVLHSGDVVGARTRYSDPLLMFAIRDLRLRRQAAGSGPGAGGHIAHPPPVIIDPLEEDDEDD